MSKYYKAEDVLAIFSEEERPLNWTDSESETQAQNDFDYYKGMIESLPTIEVSEDAVSREYMLRALNGYGKDWQEDCEIAETIKNAPSVVPKPKVSEWILECDAEGEGDNLYRCPECGQRCGCQEYDLPNYCGNCGAKMHLE